MVELEPETVVCMECQAHPAAKGSGVRQRVGHECGYDGRMRSGRSERATESVSRLSGQRKRRAKTRCGVMSAGRREFTFYVKGVHGACVRLEICG